MPPVTNCHNALIRAFKLPCDDWQTMCYTLYTYRMPRAGMCLYLLGRWYIWYIYRPGRCSGVTTAADSHILR